MNPDIFDPDFQKWAFGGGISHVDELMQIQWNARHSDILELKPCDRIYESFKKMWDLYLKFKFPHKGKRFIPYKDDDE